MEKPVSREVWLVEDNALYRESLQGVLSASEHVARCRTFGECETMLAALEADGPPDVVLMDIGLPGMNGIEGVSRIRALAPALPVIMVTVHEDRDRIFRAVCAGSSGYLLKSAAEEEIFSAIDRVCRGGAAMDAHTARQVLDMFADLNRPGHDYGLSDREKEILTWLVEGLTKKQIAEQVFLSPHTIDRHLRNIYAKMHVHSRGRAVTKALRERLL